MYQCSLLLLLLFFESFTSGIEEDNRTEKIKIEF